MLYKFKNVPCLHQYQGLCEDIETDKKLTRLFNMNGYELANFEGGLETNSSDYLPMNLA